MAGGKTIKMVAIVLGVAIVLVILLRVVWRLLSVPGIYAWQVRNDDTVLVLGGYLAPLKDRLGDVKYDEIHDVPRYEGLLVKRAAEEGISPKKLWQALQAASPGGVPVYIDTAWYEGRPVFAVLWEYPYGGGLLSQLFGRQRAYGYMFKVVDRDRDTVYFRQGTY